MERRSIPRLWMNTMRLVSSIYSLMKRLAKMCWADGHILSCPIAIWLPVKLISLSGVDCVRRMESFWQERAKLARELCLGRIQVLGMGAWCQTVSSDGDV